MPSSEPAPLNRSELEDLLEEILDPVLSSRRTAAPLAAGLAPLSALHQQFVLHWAGAVASSSTDRRGAKTQTASLSAKPLYHFKLEGGPDKVFLTAGPRIYTGGKGVVAAFEAARGETEGGARRPVWSTPIEGDVWNMLAADDRLFVMTTDARLYCFGGEAPAKVTQHRLAHDRLDEQRDHTA